MSDGRDEVTDRVARRFESDDESNEQTDTNAQNEESSMNAMKEGKGGRKGTERA